MGSIRKAEMRFLSYHLFAILLVAIGQSRAEIQYGESDRFITWGTFDTTVTDFQTINVWLRFHNTSDSEIVISDRGTGKNNPTLLLEKSGQRVKLFKCPDFSLRLPPHSSYFKFCAGEVPSLADKFNEESKDGSFVLQADSFWMVPNASLPTRILQPENLQLYEFMNKMDHISSSLSRNEVIKVNTSRGTVNVSKEAFYQCKPLQKELSSIYPGECFDGLCVAAQRRLIMNFCLTESLRSIPNTFAPNWPWLKNHAKCTSLAFKQKKSPAEVCLHEDRDRNIAVKSILGLNAVIDDRRLPYKFIAGSDTVLIGASSWINGVAGEVFE